MNIKCPICSQEFENSSLFEHHLKTFHFMSYDVFCEIMMLSNKEEDYFCYRCKTYQSPLTYLLPDQYYMPCKTCSTSTNKRGNQFNNVIRSIFENSLKDYLDRIVGDRYFQLFISNPKYFRNTLPHNYTEFKSILGHLELPNRNDFWYVGHKPGYPKILSTSNLEALGIINCTDKYKVETLPDRILINEYVIHLPEIVPYDVKHHSRYNILNKGSDRRTKRLKLNSSECIKFFNLSESNIKSIFKITKDEKSVQFKDLSERDKIIIPMVIFRNKTQIRLIFEIINEISKVSNDFKDEVFLRNSINIDSTKNTNFALYWHHSNENLSSECINLSLF